jgi:hypothetical protein
VKEYLIFFERLSKREDETETCRELKNSKKIFLKISINNFYLFLILKRCLPGLVFIPFTVPKEASK